MDISAYSLVACCRAAAPLMPRGGTIVTISYFGGEKVMPGYNLMGVCKAALEHSVRYLAWDLGRLNKILRSTASAPARCGPSVRPALPASTRCASTPPEILSWPQRRVPRSWARTGLYLLGDLSSGVTGETLHVDCGYSIVGL